MANPMDTTCAAYALLSVLSLVVSTDCIETSDCLDCRQDFTYCVTKQINKTISDSGPDFCECSPNYPIVLDNRFCLPFRLFNQSCYLTEQCQQKSINSNLGCFRDGHNLLESHHAMKQVTDSLSSVPEAEDPTARCGCPPNHYYDIERRYCFCVYNYKNVKKCRTKGQNMTGDDFMATPLLFEETIFLWVILMLILTLIFMVLTICRKCFCSQSNYYSYVDYRTGVCSRTTTTTLIDCSFTNSLNDRQFSINLIRERPPTYEEAIHS